MVATVASSVAAAAAMVAAIASPIPPVPPLMVLLMVPTPSARRPALVLHRNSKLVGGVLAGPGNLAGGRGGPVPAVGRVGGVAPPLVVAPASVPLAAPGLHLHRGSGLGGQNVSGKLGSGAGRSPLLLLSRLLLPRLLLLLSGLLLLPRLLLLGRGGGRGGARLLLLLASALENLEVLDIRPLEDDEVEDLIGGKYLGGSPASIKARGDPKGEDASVVSVGRARKENKRGQGSFGPANQPSSFLFFFVAHARARPAGGPGARRGNAMRVRACTYRPSVPKLFTFCNAMLLSTVSIVYRTPSYRISLFEMSEMREPMYGVAIFDQASGRFAALPLSLSPSLAARRSLCLLCLSLRCFSNLLFFLEDGGRMQKRFLEIFWYTIPKAIHPKKFQSSVETSVVVFRVESFSRATVERGSSTERTSRARAEGGDRPRAAQ